jgi:CO/xanthine dehydrogenase FAD-binding subunit
MSYHRPRELETALRILSGTGSTVLAGGTDLYPATQRPALAGPILDVTAIAGLSDIALVPGGLRIGAAACWSALAAALLPPALLALQQAAREVGAIQIQNAGTIGGNLCNASPAADGVPPLLACGAEVELASIRGTRRLGLGAFIEGPRRTARAPDELLTAVILPEAGLAGRSAFLKLGARRYLVISIAMVAARVEIAGGRIERAAIAVGACSAVARRLPEVEAALAGQPAGAPMVDPEAVAAALAPIDDARGTAGYRLQAAAELVARAVRQAAGPDRAAA